MSRGRLRIYLGAAPGVGKTYAMLGEGHRRLARGTDVVVGFVETHGRAHTQQMIAGLEVIERRAVDYRGGTFQEMDVDAILRRDPAVALVDELAHTNVPGAGNAKRWQDIERLLEAGIHVISTVNIQHLESVNDIIESITGTRQRETVPDAVVRAADQLELVDMSPEALRRRMAHGNVYEAEKVDAALSNYFRVGNLTALRELALLWVADRVDEGLERYRAEHDIHDTWAARQRIVVAVTDGPEGEALLRRGALIAGRANGRDLVAVHVLRSDGISAARPENLTHLRALTEDLGGTFHTVVGDDVPAAILDFARSVNGTQIVVGASRRRHPFALLVANNLDAIVRASGEIDVHVVTHEKVGRAWPRARRLRRRRRYLAWAGALIIPAVVTLALVPFRDSVSLGTVLLTYLLGVVAVALAGGLGPAIATSLVAGLAANWFFTPPVGKLTIGQPENAFALVAFVIVGVVVATIVDRSLARAAQALRSSAEATVLAELSAGVLRRPDGVWALLDQAMETFALDGATLFEDVDGRPVKVEVRGTNPPRSPESAEVLVDAGPGLQLALNGHPLAARDLRMLDAFATQAAAVLERNRLAARADDANRLRQVDAVRSALLAAVSHDLRTPMSGIKAALDTLSDPALDISDADRAALLADATQSADRLGAILTNLLEMGRIQAGVVTPVISAVSVDEVIQRALRGLRSDEVRDLTDESLPLISTDVGLLERALANVLENAAEHSPTGRPPVITGGLTPDGRLELRVVDRGPGVPDSEKERMFAAFQRLRDAPAGAGVGLGLAVARGLTEAVGGSLTPEDTPGGGLTMVFSLPAVARPVALPEESRQ